MGSWQFPSLRVNGSVYVPYRPSLTKSSLEEVTHDIFGDCNGSHFANPVDLSVVCLAPPPDAVSTYNEAGTGVHWLLAGISADSPSQGSCDQMMAFAE